MIPLEGEGKYNSGINPRSRSEGKDYETEISLNEEKLGSDDLTLSSIRLDNIIGWDFLVGSVLIMRL